MGGLLSVAAQSALAEDSAHRLIQALLLFTMIGGAIAVYGLSLNWLGVIGWREAISAVRRRQRSDLRS